MSIREDMLERELIANRRKHWVRAVTACSSRCVFCLDMDTPRNVFLPVEEIQAELRRGREELSADKVIISGGEATLHPAFSELIAYGRSIGYDRVQTVTNGWNFADRGFYQRCMEAGLGEITFSLHGHTPELHDRLTRHPGSFARLMKGMIRAVRDRSGPIVNVDVVINKQNVGVLDRIVELCISVGVTEFDLLHVIPQSEAFRNREMLFYDVRDHMEVLHRVFRLNRHPRFVIWTNRFPVSYLEGLEDLIQDPHKMLDEVNGRRFQVRRYLDTGEPLDCRQPERCQHCFIEPFCTTVDRVVAQQQERAFAVWQTDNVTDTLPFGCDRLGLTVPTWTALAALPLPAGVSLELSDMEPVSLPELDVSTRLIADTPAQLDAWLSADDLGPVTVEIRLTAQTAAWMLAHRDRLVHHQDRLRIHQPSFAQMSQAMDSDVRDPAAFFTALDLRLPVSGLPACLAPGCELTAPIARLSAVLFDPETGRLDTRGISNHHIEQGYTAKSTRCRDCVVDTRCDGIHINMIRDQGLKLARPLTDGPWAEDALAQLTARWPEPPRRVGDGRPTEPPADSLPGFAPPATPPRDPLAVIAEKLEIRRATRRAARKAMLDEARQQAEET